MKRYLLCLALLALMAAPAAASVQIGSSGNSQDVVGSGHDRRGSDSDDVTNDTAVAPVPEPGTMALASMGLIALGAAARARRKK